LHDINSIKLVVERINTMKHQQQLKYSFIFMVILIIAGLLLIACGGVQAQDKPFTIGILSEVPIFDPTVIEGFKAGMAELGYVEGENVTYLYTGATGADPQAMDSERENILAQKVDVLLVISPGHLTRAMPTVTDIPIVFAAIMRPVELGFVESISHPGGNITGVQVPDIDPKALEWLLKVSPEIKKVYVPYNPADEVSLMFWNRLDKVPSQLNIELVPGEVHSVEEAVTTIESLPADIDAIYRLPSPTLEQGNNELSQATIKRGLPVATGVPLDGAVVLILMPDLVKTGEQAARLVHQIRQGTKPADLPVETSDLYLTLNLKTAEAIDLDIPDEILRQADKIIR
jgi:putative ABC transport system substrate-binding protein